jgi:hypothetical protein
VIRMFPDLQLVSFAVVDDRGRFIRRAHPADYVDAEYACGCYQFTRPAP